MEPSPGDEYVYLIQFLLENGADPNTLSSPAANETFQRHADVGGTTLDQLGRSLLEKHPGLSTSMILRNVTIFKRLTAAGGEFSKPFDTLKRIHPNYRCEHFTVEVDQFICFEDQQDREFTVN